MAMGDASCCSRAPEPDNRCIRAFKRLIKALSGEYKLRRQRRASSSEADSRLPHKSFSCSSLAEASATPETRQEQSKLRRHSNGSFGESRTTYIAVFSVSAPLGRLPEQGNAATVDLFTNSLIWAPGNVQQFCTGVPADDTFTVVTPDYGKPQHGVPFQLPALAQPAANAAEPGAAAAWSLALSSTVDDNPQQGGPSQHLVSAEPAANAAAPGAVTAWSPALGSALDDHKVTVDQQGCTPSLITDAEAKRSNVVAAALELPAAQHMYQAGKTVDAANMSPVWIHKLVLAAQRDKLTPAEPAVTFGCGARLCDLGDELDSLATLPLINPYEQQAAAAVQQRRGAAQQWQDDCGLVSALSDALERL